MNILEDYPIEQQQQPQNDPRYRGLHHASPEGGPGPRLLTANTLTGNRVVNRADETLGHIEEIMLDTDLGLIAYAVMASGGFLSFSERLFAIPWSALTLDPVRGCFVMNASKDYFDQAPGFDKQHWPSMADAEWHEEVHHYYGIRPYWD